MGRNWLISSSRTLLALGQKDCFVYNSGQNFKNKKKINIREYCELQKKKKIEKVRSESKLNSCIYLKSNECILNFIELCVYWLFMLVGNVLILYN